MPNVNKDTFIFPDRKNKMHLSMLGVVNAKIRSDFYSDVKN